MLVIKDFATTTTASALTAEATSITVVNGSKFPSLVAGDYFYAVIQDFYDRRAVEVVKVLGVSGNELSVERGRDGTVGRAFSAGAYVELRLTVRTFAEFIAQSGVVLGSLLRSYEEAGYNVVGTFREGFTIVNANDVGIDETTGKGFTGPVGPVAAGTNPSSGGFVDRSAETLRHKLALNIGAGMVATADGRTVQERFDNIDAEVDAAGTAASLIAQHNASATAHPAVSISITPAGDAAILDLASATVFRVTLNAHITQIAFTNASGEEGSSRSVTLILRQGTGVNLASWPENIRWAYGHLPVLSYEKDAEDYITLVRFGADAHWYGFLTGGWFHV